MVAIAPPALVQAPARQPLQYGLLSVLVPRVTNDRWENGVQWEPGTLEPVDGVGAPVAPPDQRDQVGLPKNLDPVLSEWGSATPFTVYGHFQCSPVGFPQAQAQALALQHLFAGEEARVEQALWTGDLGNSPALATDPNLDTLAADVVSIEEGFALLEQHAGETYRATGVIHADRGTALRAVGEGVLVASGGVLRTALGTPVVAGAGYPGTGPDNEYLTDADTAWVFVSPPLLGYRTEPFTPDPVLDQATNDLYAIAERTYVIGFDPQACGAVQVQR